MELVPLLLIARDLPALNLTDHQALGLIREVVVDLLALGEVANLLALRVIKDVVEVGLLTLGLKGEWLMMVMVVLMR